MSLILVSVLLAGDCQCLAGQPCECQGCTCDTYEAAYARARKEGKTLIVFKGQDAETVPGCVSCRNDSLGQGPVRGYVAARWDGEDDMRVIRKGGGKPPSDCGSQTVVSKPIVYTLVYPSYATFGRESYLRGQFRSLGVRAGPSCSGGSCH